MDEEISRECPCCGYDDETEHIFDGTKVSCGCPCWWSVDEDGAYIAEGDEPCAKCLVEEVESLEKRIAELEAQIHRLENPKCWHCGEALDEVPLRCNSCPFEDDCDDPDCTAPGCADDVAAFRCEEVSRG